VASDRWLFTAGIQSEYLLKARNEAPVGKARVAEGKVGAADDPSTNNS
jgi:hypothetical protein